jgi:DNA (cytosine-5)-methyltransferase 1
MKAYYNEYDKKTAAWLRELIRDGLIADGDVDERSICDVRPDDLLGYTQCHFFAGIGGWALALRIAGWPDDEPVWTGSCPCQPWSTAGEGRGFSDDRHLWPAWHRLIREHSPRIIFGEQVASDLALRWIDAVFSDLEAENYACGAADLCAASIDARHIRPRLWWVANSNRQRQQKPWQHRKDTGNYSPVSFGEADRLVGSIRRDDLPFLCRQHYGLPARVGSAAATGFGNAIVPQLAAQFIIASVEAINNLSKE